MNQANLPIKLINIKFILPSLLAIVLFGVAIFGISLPILQNNLVKQKKDQITTLTQTAWNTLSYYNNKTLAGDIPFATAQQLAKEQIQVLRYGQTGKDYFWINDLRPHMVMHPYLPELEGKDLSEYTDQNGKYPFNEFVSQTKQKGGGFVPYMWQWNDIPDRISPKLSYVKLFKPWGWIIGTGVYLDDVETEVQSISHRLIILSIFILIIVSFLLFLIVQQSNKEMVRRKSAEIEVQQYQNNLEKLVQERTSELSKTLAEVKTLRGIVPICANCKKIRDDKGFWNQVEIYVSRHTEAQFSHGICPDCSKQLYPELFHNQVS